MSKRVLMFLTGVCTASSVIMLTIALATDYWVLTKEIKKHEDDDNANKTTTIIEDTIGLWRSCRKINNGFPSCKTIDHFPADKVSDTSEKPGDRIFDYIRASSAFPILSLALQFAATVVCFWAHFRKHRLHLTLTAGVLSVLAGLCSIVGLLMYISNVSDEYGSKARPKSAYSDQTFFYKYGWSFMLAVSSFTLTELAGVLLVYLHISRHKHTIRKHLEARTHHVDEYPRLRSRSWSGSKTQDLCQSLTYSQYDSSTAELGDPNVTTDSTTDFSMSLLNASEGNYLPKRPVHKQDGRLSRPYSFETVRKTTPV
ncbi:voltage-dependent calcium channel gamma-7 subunit-like isoform X1 [Ptychodera flava]|uniref:voltage-dependent calcium channel gamma-7 subunit-like isoform X1 n=1 Tax=Ptychodera flava TaxID=63121 RepID=UPI00396A8B64